MMNRAQQEWPSLDKEQRAMYLAMVALGWDSMNPEQQLTNYRALIAKASAYERAL